MRELVLDLDAADGLNDPPAAQRVLERYASLHADALSVNGVRIVAVSASAMPREIEAALAAGFDNDLTKPATAEQLPREVDRTLARVGVDAVRD